MIEMRLIPCQKIRVPKGTKYNDNTINLLHDSIKTEGMYHPIVVRPDPQHPGDYLVVQGKHRFKVKSQLMKEEFIEARVFADMDEEEARLASLTENACRLSPNGNKRLILIRDWQEAFRKKYPDLIDRRAGGKVRAWRQAEARRAAAREGGSAHEDPSRSAGGPIGANAAQAGDARQAEGLGGQGRPTTFTEYVAAATDRSKETVKRDLYLLNHFTPEQIEALGAIDLPMSHLRALIKATKGNENERAEVVNLVCSGMPVEDAIREVTGVAEVKDLAGRTKEADTAEGAEAKKAEDDGTGLSDDEWFAVYCGEFAQYLGNPGKYRTDALLFRWMADARAAFRKKVKRAFARAKEGAKGSNDVGPWFFLAHRILNASHPKDWLLCDVCRGSARNEDGGTCKKCFESGYCVKTEKYL